MIKYFEAFAGIGAFRSAFEKVGGFECVGWCEIDRFAQKAYRTLYDTKGEIFYEDITKIDYGNMPDFDLLVGGPCCQSFSVAGRRLAFEDDRGNLHSSPHTSHSGAHENKGRIPLYVPFTAPDPR